MMGVVGGLLDTQRSLHSGIDEGCVELSLHKLGRGTSPSTKGWVIFFGLLGSRLHSAEIRRGPPPTSHQREEAKREEA